jgi:hypothetical protein
MSEYQCYEFVALDRQLTAKEMTELRAVSTRAEITPTRFWNDYAWGDLKADSAKLLERYFDAHSYVSNWGTRRLMLRIPAKAITARALRSYFVGDAAKVRATGKYVIIDLISSEEGADYHVEDEDNGTLTSLLPLRAELLRGDLRVCYLAWLLAVQAGDMAEDAMEPPVPAGLSKLTVAQKAMVEFLRIDEALVAAAAAASPVLTDDTPGLRAWVRALDGHAKDAWLARAVEEPDLALGAELLRTFRQQVKAPRRRARSVASLIAAAEAKHAKARRA